MYRYQTHGLRLSQSGFAMNCSSIYQSFWNCSGIRAAIPYGGLTHRLGFSCRPIHKNRRFALKYSIRILPLLVIVLFGSVQLAKAQNATVYFGTGNRPRQFRMVRLSTHFGDGTLYSTPVWAVYSKQSRRFHVPPSVGGWL